MDEEAIRSCLRAAFPDARMPEPLAARVQRGMVAAGADVGEAMREAHPPVAMPEGLGSRIVLGAAVRAAGRGVRRPLRVRLVLEYGAAMGLVAVCLGLAMQMAVMRFSGTRAVQHERLNAAAPAAGVEQAPTSLGNEAAKARPEPTRSWGGAQGQKGGAVSPETRTVLSYRPDKDHGSDYTYYDATVGLKVRDVSGVSDGDLDAVAEPPKGGAAEVTNGAVECEAVSGHLALGGLLSAAGRVPVLGEYGGSGGMSGLEPAGPRAYSAGRMVVVGFEPSTPSEEGLNEPAVSRFYAEVADPVNNVVTVSSAEEGESVSIHTSWFYWDRSGVRALSGPAATRPGEERAPNRRSDD
jgi:hypothetical protein